MTIRSLGEAPPKLAAPKAPPRAASHVTAPSHAGDRSPFQRMLEGIGNEINRGERTVHGALAAGGGSSSRALSSPCKRASTATARPWTSRRSSSIAPRAA